MNNASRTLSAILLAFALLLPPAASAEPPPLAPVNQPLCVLRAADAKAIQSLLATRQAKALGLDYRDYSGRIPGLNAAVDSLNAFLAALAQNGAKNLWYCLSQQGSSLTGQTGAMGWDAPDNPGETLPGMRGPDPERRPLSPGVSRVIICRDSDAREELFGGAGLPNDGWRDSLAAFLSGRGDSAAGDSIGVWVNARPILGLLSLLGDIDIRAIFRACNLAPPVWTRLELFNNQGDLGFEARINNILPQNMRSGGNAPVLIHAHDAPLLEVNIPAVAGLWDMIVPESDAFLLANINMAALIPQSVAVSVRPGANGGYAMDVVCLMPDKRRFAEQFARLRAWLEFLSAAPTPAFAIEEAQSRWGDTLWKIRIGDVSLVMGVADASTGDGGTGGGAFLVIAPTVAGWPDPAKREIVAGDTPCIAQWRVSLDSAARADIANHLAQLSRQRGSEDFSPAFWDAMLPSADAGRVGVENNTLVIRSDSGLAPLLVPGVTETFLRAFRNNP